MATVTIGAFTGQYLTAQPYGYEGDARDGLTARRWAFQCVLTPAEEASLLSVYDTWRNTRITDEDTLSSGTVGTTVSLTTATDTVSASGLACWFTSAPQSEQSGVYKLVSFEVVDAAQALSVLLREQEKSRERQEALRGTYGTETLGSATLTLTRPKETYQDGPELRMLATGSHYLTGTLAATRVRDVEGYTDATGWTNVRSWYETTIASTPSPGAWFPISAPTASAEVIIDGGAKSTRYTVTVQLAEVR